ncbi:MAG TPA: FlgD immunoglobulin-like domain containing protein, partial [Candidatus Kapabacteria bacterium]
LNGPYTLFAALEYDGPSSIPSDYQTYSIFYLKSEPRPTGIEEFAMDNAGLDPEPNVGNDIPKLTRIEGKGIGFKGMTGSFAMKFKLVRPDTFYGARVYFGSASQNPDSVQFSLWTADSDSSIPKKPLTTNPPMMFRRGPDFDQFSTYYNGQPIALAAGTYWIAVSQLDTESMELGGNTFRGGAEAIQQSRTAPRIQAMYNDSLYGTQCESGAGDNNGNVTGMFAYETPAASGNWKTMTPDSGWWPAMDSASGLTPIVVSNLDSTRWSGLGSYFPVIRPMIASYVPPLSVEQKTVPSLFISTYPNPFDPSSHSVEISFTLSTQSFTSVTISNVLGNRVKTIELATLAAGTHSIFWDGKEDDGGNVPMGIYVVTLSTAVGKASSKIVVMR